MSLRAEVAVMGAGLAVLAAVVALLVINDRADRDRCEHSACDVGNPVYLRAHGRMVCGCVVAPWSKQ